MNINDTGGEIVMALGIIGNSFSFLYAHLTRSSFVMFIVSVSLLIVFYEGISFILCSHKIKFGRVLQNDDYFACVLVFFSAFMYNIV